MRKKINSVNDYSGTTKFAHTSLNYSHVSDLMCTVSMMPNCFYLQKSRTGFVAFKGLSIFIT